MGESTTATTSGRDATQSESLGGSKDELYGEPMTFLGRRATDLQDGLTFALSTYLAAFLLTYSVCLRLHE